MAEVIGLTASIIGIGELAAQAAQIVLKLRQIWDEVKEAPDDITFMMRELDILVSSLATIENQHKNIDLPSHVFDTSDMRQSLNLCQDAAKQLADLVAELALQVDSGGRFKKKIGAAKLFMKKDQIQKIRMKLNSSISLFKLCRETYTSTLMPDIIALKLYKLSPNSKIIEMPESLAQISNCSQLSTDTQSSSRSSASSKIYKTQGLQRRTSNLQTSLWILGSKLLGTIECETSSIVLDMVSANESENETSITPHVAGKIAKIRVRPASWLMGKVWEAFSHSVYGKWTYSFRTYNVAPNDAPVFQCARMGDLNGLRDLFERKQATPFDRQESNNSLLRNAIPSLNTEVCYLLMDLTKEPADIRDAVDLIWIFAIWGGKLLPLEYENLCRRLAVYIDNMEYQDTSLDSSLGIEIIAWLLKRFVGNSATFDIFVAHFIPTYWKRPQVVRTLSAIGYASMDDFHSPDMVWKILGLGAEVLDLEIAETEYSHDGTLLHQCTRNLWYIVLHTIPCENPHWSPIGLERFMPRFISETMVSCYGDWASSPYESWTPLRPKNLRKNSHLQWNKERQSNKPWKCILYDDWCVFLRHLLNTGVSLHIGDKHGRTPLLFAIHQLLGEMMATNQLIPSDLEAAANAVLRIWLQALIDVGVDIEEYGANENRLYSTQRVNKNMRVYEWSRYWPTDGSPYMDWQVLSIKYGSSLEDWIIRGSEPTDGFAGEFWTMIDHSEWRIPGAWIEEEAEALDREFVPRMDCYVRCL